MNRQEKIDFIRKSRSPEFAYAQLEEFSEAELDFIIQKILDELQKEESVVTDNSLTSFYIYLN